jgi:preprotein translocase SecE subunit
VQQFLKEVVIEFNKITWPGRAQVVQETYSVLFLVTVITLMVLSFDWFLGKAIFGPLEYWARIHGGGIGRG